MPKKNSHGGSRHKKMASKSFQYSKITTHIDGRKFSNKINYLVVQIFVGK